MTTRATEIGSGPRVLRWGFPVISLVSCLMFAATAVRTAGAAQIALDRVYARPHPSELDELRRVWLGQLNELIATARELAVADDTYDFVKRPNIPYVDEHYDPERLVAERIDTVLIVNLRGQPLFWRRINQGQNHGFPDARQFLAELPQLESVGVAGVPSLAGAAKLVHGPKLLVALPIYASGGSGAARGWLIAARPLDPFQWSRYEELAHVSEESVEAASPSGPNLTREFLALADLQRVAAVDSPMLQTIAASISPATPSSPSHSVPLWAWLLIGLCGPLLIVAIRRGPNPMMAWLRTPKGGVAMAPIASESCAILSAAPIRVASPSARAHDPLTDRLAASNAVFRFQPQIDLQTGRVAGVEALLCVPGPRGFRPAIELASEMEDCGEGLPLVERRLREACRVQSAWARRIGHEFPMGVSVSQRSLANAAFLPLVQRILADHELAPSLLELQVEEAVPGASAVALRVRALHRVRDAGLSIALDGFNAAHTNLRLLAILPIAKLRVDPKLLPTIHNGATAAPLFAGIVGAARGFGIIVCATGVDSSELLSVVLQHGRPLAQGAALGAIQTEDELLELLCRNNVDTATLPVLDFEDEGLQLAPT